MLLTAFTSSSYAASDQTGFYLGAEYGDAALNNDLYIYSSEANTRQPELQIRESYHKDSSTYSLYVGYHFINKAINLFGQEPTLQLGFQGGYTDFGKITYKVSWNNSGKTTEGQRKIEEDSIDMLLSSTLIWKNGLNLSGKIGIARLSGKYEDVNLPNIRQPEGPINQKADFTVYRPELAFGVGYLIHQKMNIYLQYNTIIGDTPDSSGDRFGNLGYINLPNTVYKADRFTLGLSYMF